MQLEKSEKSEKSNREGMQEAMSEDERSFEQKVEEELAQMDPAALGEDRKLPYCKKHKITDVLWHEWGKNLTEYSCELLGCCYPCIREGVYKRVYNLGRSPPLANKIKCTDLFHNYLSLLKITKFDFLERRKPVQITEEEADFLSQLGPVRYKGEAEYLFQ